MERVVVDWSNRLYSWEPMMGRGRDSQLFAVLHGADKVLPER